MHKIAKELNIAIGSVYNYIKEYGIETRDQKATFTFKGRRQTPEAILKTKTAKIGMKMSEETRRKISEARKIKGTGHLKIREDGYIAIYFPTHPFSNNDGYVMQHRYIMEQEIGRFLTADEVVHHVNGDRKDNRLENLKLMTFKEHSRHHMKERHNKKII